MEDATSDFVYVPFMESVENCRDPGKIFSGHVETAQRPHAVFWSTGKRGNPALRIFNPNSSPECDLAAGARPPAK
jgi:hypothetical protein